MKKVNKEISLEQTMKMKTCLGQQEEEFKNTRKKICSAKTEKKKDDFCLKIKFKTFLNLTKNK